MLEPKPKSNFKPKTWEELNETLKRAFNSNTSNPTTIINTDDYEMSKENIVEELIDKGYEVSYGTGNHIYIS